MTEFPLYVPLHVPFPNVGPLVKGLLSLAQPQLHFHAAFFEVEGQGDEGKALFLGFSCNAFDLITVKEKLLFTIRVMVKNRRKRVFRDIQGAQPDFPLDYLGPGIGERDFSVPE